MRFGFFIPVLQQRHLLSGILRTEQRTGSRQILGTVAVRLLEHTLNVVTHFQYALTLFERHDGDAGCVLRRLRRNADGVHD